jgi:hypothetical protein
MVIFKILPCYYIIRDSLVIGRYLVLWESVAHMQLPAPPFTCSRSPTVCYATRSLQDKSRPLRTILYNSCNPSTLNYQPEVSAQMARPTLIDTIDNLLFRGNSKDTFVQERIVPANANDAYYDDKCLFCWCGYDDAHTSVRILPCNHIVGRDCLNEYINTPFGDTCPVCRTSLFRSLRNFSIDRLLYALLDRMAPRLPPVEPFPFAGEVAHRATQVLMFWLHRNNIYYYVNLITKHCTSLPARNVDLSPNAAAEYFSRVTLRVELFSFALRFLGWECGILQYTFRARLGRTWAIAGFIYCWVGHGRIDSLKDRCMFAVVMIAAVLANAVVNLGLVWWYSEGF